MTAARPTPPALSLGEWIDALLDAEVDELNMVAIAALRSSLALQELVCVRHGVTVRWTGMARHLRETEAAYRAAHPEDGPHAALHRRGDLRPRTAADAPAPMPWSVSTCGSCGAPVIWAVWPSSGKSMPVDADPLPAGDLLLIAPTDPAAPPKVIRLHTEAERAEVGNQPLRTSHFATCPHADVHRRPR